MSNDDKRSYRGGPIIAVAVALLLLVPLAYVAGYFGLSAFSDDDVMAVRTFKAGWQVTFFKPALLIEKRCRGELWASFPRSSGAVVGGTIVYPVD